MSEPFSISKWFSGWVDGKTWGKSLILGAMFCIILFLAFTIYRAYFMKTGSNILKPVHNPSLIMLPGSGDVGTLDQSQDIKSEQKTEQKKRSWWLPIPFVALYGEVQTENDSKGNPDFGSYDTGFGAQIGVRWDFY